METFAFELEADELEAFLQDVNEHVQAMETGILNLEQAADPETLNAIFRAAHTLKAVAGAVGHQPMAELTHTMETLFDAMREGRLSPTQAMADELLAAVDVLRTLRDEVVNRRSSGLDVAPYLARLRMMSGAHPSTDGAAGRPSPVPSLPPVSIPLTPEQAAQIQDCRREGYTIFEITVETGADAFAPAARLLQAAMAMAAMGQVIAQQPSEDALLDDQHSGRLWLVLATRAEARAVETRLADITDLAGFHVQAYPAPISPSEGTAGQAAPSAPGKPAGAMGQEPEKTVRISTERLDTLMDLVGELVTDRTRLNQITQTLRARYGKEGSVQDLDETIAHVGQIIGQLQDEVMQARMVPIAHLFDKFPRLVRDVARAADKQVNLVVEGESTELDRSIIEIIGDPLIHLLRNAVSHGIESPQARLAAGKPPAGVVRLAAEHAEGQIVITVADDGQGIDPAKIRRAAVSRGVITEEEAARLGDDEAVALIFRPGLSTAEQVTGTSGRGVGLDVVRANLNRIGGSVVVESEPGRGTLFRITLPLTLAIVQTMLAALGNDVYAIPLTSIVESLYLSDVNVGSVKGSPAIRWRDQVLPLLHLRQFFGLPVTPEKEPRAEEAKPAIIAVAWGKLRAGLVVDKLIGKQDIVIKPLGPIIGNVPGLAGCAILGDGRIALIVDVPGLVNAAALRSG